MPEEPVRRDPGGSIDIDEYLHRARVLRWRAQRRALARLSRPWRAAGSGPAAETLAAVAPGRG